MRLDHASLIRGFLAGALLLVPFGSVEDRVLLVAVWAVSRVPIVRLRFNQLQACFGSVTVYCILLNAILTVWAWGNARFRTGGGPFHIVEADTWRGYPFMFENWDWGDASVITVWREFHWLGLVGDVLLLVLACIGISWRLRPLPLPLFPIFLCLACGVFVWFNIEPWVFGTPVTLIGPPPPALPDDMRKFWSTFTIGFP